MVLIYLSLIFFLILGEFIHEGIKSNGRHILSGTIESIWLLGIILITCSFATGYLPKFIGYHPEHFIRLFISYLCIRFSIGAYIYNLCAILPLSYLGDTKFYDKSLKWIMEKCKVPFNFIVFIQLCTFIIGMLLILFINRV